MHRCRFTPRFTVRQLMVAVALMGIVFGVTIERRDRFMKLMDYHRAEFKKLVPLVPMFAGSSDHPNVLRLEWHESMRLKYEHAAQYPWLPVEPDTPEPR